MNFLRRIPLNRLLLLCGIVVVVGIGATALASALGAGPTPQPKPLAQAIHDGLAAPAPEGVSANIQLTNELLEGAGLANAGGGGDGGGGSSITSSPLFTGGSGRLWASKDGRFRLELQDQGGDTQVIYDGHTLEVYDAATNTLYRYTPPKGEPGEDSSGSSSSGSDHHEVPSVKQIEEAISHLQRHASVSGAEPSDVAGQPAYTVRVGPKEPGSLFAGAELSFNADNGTPLRTALYSTADSSPVLELAATEISYGPVPDSVFSITPPSNVKVEEVKLEDHATARKHSARSHASEVIVGVPAKEYARIHHTAKRSGSSPKVTTYGHGPGAIVVLQGRSKGSGKSGELEGLPQVDINGTKADELRTELGTLLSFERSGVRYLLAGSVSPAQLEAVARGL